MTALLESFSSTGANVASLALRSILMAKKLFIKTHGCQMNEYDSARMADLLGESHRASGAAGVAGRVVDARAETAQRKPEDPQVTTQPR